MPIRIQHRALLKMIEHARTEHPFECCGLLSGDLGLVQTATPATNAIRNSHRFFVPPVELFAFFRRIRRSQERFLGIYHSHPFSEAVPSRRDAEEFFYPEASYWIVSGTRPEPEVRCFIWSGVGFEETPFQIVGA